MSSQAKTITEWTAQLQQKQGKSGANVSIEPQVIGKYIVFQQSFKMHNVWEAGFHFRKFASIATKYIFKN